MTLTRWHFWIATMHKYWVLFVVQLVKNAGNGAMEVTRELPICGEADVLETARAIKEALVKHQGLDPVSNVQVMSWTKFEEPSILRTTVIPPNLATPPAGSNSLLQTSLSH